LLVSSLGPASRVGETMPVAEQDGDPCFVNGFRVSGEAYRLSTSRHQPCEQRASPRKDFTSSGSSTFGGADVDGVARPHLRADRPPVAVDHQDQLAKIGAMVLAVVSVCPPAPSRYRLVVSMNTRARRVNRSRRCRTTLLRQILDAAGCERGAAALIIRRQLVAVPGHRAKPIWLGEAALP
jgi:hypothetical protein